MIVDENVNRYGITLCPGSDAGRVCPKRRLCRRHIALSIHQRDDWRPRFEQLPYDGSMPCAYYLPCQKGRTPFRDDY